MKNLPYIRKASQSRFRTVLPQKIQAKKWACRCRPEILLGGYPTTGKRLHISVAPIYCCVDSHSKARMRVAQITSTIDGRIQTMIHAGMTAGSGIEDKAVSKDQGVKWYR
ncbi:hypothetical protein FNL37_1207 [Methylovorus glucosotrophus]|nr:hypothetical protein FNL37_1207 [Methylovorus glucosotrophus]